MLSPNWQAAIVYGAFVSYTIAYWCDLTGAPNTLFKAGVSRDRTLQAPHKFNERFVLGFMGKYQIGRGRHRSKRWIYAAPLAVLLVVAMYPLVGALGGEPRDDTPTSQATLSAQNSTDQLEGIEQLAFTEQMPWPTYGQSAYGLVQKGVLGQSGNTDTPVPIASLAKVITALAVLNKKPLEFGEQGPTITLTEQDEANYWEYVRKEGSVTPVRAGVTISQYQALQAMMLSSSNNISDALVVWAFGSMDNYVAYANNMLREMGFSKTTVADASGYSPQTIGTAGEVVKLGILYLQHPVLREIAEQNDAHIPYAGTIYNLNMGINTDELLGIKVGFTDEAGRTFLAAKIKGRNKDDISVAAVLGAVDWDSALQDTKALLLSGDKERERAENGR